MVDKKRIGIIGMGWWATIHVPIIMNSERARLVSISRRNADKLEQARIEYGLNPSQAYTDWREQIQSGDLDAVIISTSHDAHVEPAIASLKAGLDVFVEKPMALMATDAKAMIQASEKHGRILMVGYNRRWSGLHRTVKSKIDQGVIGKVKQINISLAQSYTNTFQVEQMTSSTLEYMKSSGVPVWVFGDGNMEGHWKNDREKGGGMFYDAGSHFADLALWFAGSSPESVFALMETNDRNVEWYMSVQARLENGAHVLLTTNGDAHVSFVPCITVIGEGGVITMTETEAWLYKGFECQNLTSTFHNLTTTEAFIDIINGKIPNTVPDIEADVVSLTEAAYLSAAQNRIVQIRDL